MKALWGARYTPQDIGDEFGITADAVKYHLRKHGLMPPRQPKPKDQARLSRAKAKAAEWTKPQLKRPGNGDMLITENVWTPERQYWHEIALGR